jgi:hypothetical protein
LEEQKSTNLIWKNARVGLELGLGIPMGKLLQKELDEVKVGSTKTPIKVNYNIGLGVIGGYEFPMPNKRSIGLEPGFPYGMR